MTPRVVRTAHRNIILRGAQAHVLSTNMEMLVLLITKTSSFISGVPCKALLDGLKQFMYM